MPLTAVVFAPGGGLRNGTLAGLVRDAMLECRLPHRSRPRTFSKWIQTGSASLADCARTTALSRLMTSTSSASTHDRSHRPFLASWWITGSSRTATNWRCCPEEGPRLPGACSRCGAPAARRASLRARCCRASDNRHTPFRSRRQACRSGRTESSVLWRTMLKSRSRRWRLSLNFESVGIDIEPAEPLAPDLLDIVATAKEREKMT